LEFESFSKYLNGIDAIANKHNNKAAKELCSRLLKNTTIDEHAIFGKVHMFKSWYDRLFAANKAQLLLDLCREQGYTVTINELTDITPQASLKNAITLHREELRMHTIVTASQSLEIELNDCLLLNMYNNIGNPEYKFSDFINHQANMKDKFNAKIKYLSIFKEEIVDDKILASIVLNDDIFEGCVRSLPLYYKGDDANDSQIKDLDKGLAFIEKDNRIPKRLKLLRWIEKFLGFNRFEIDKIELDDEKRKLFVTEVNKLTDLLPGIIDYRVTTIKQLNSRILAKLANLTSNDRVLKFIADVYNMFDDVILYDISITKPRIDGKQMCITTYINFAKNDEIIKCHNKFNGKLNSDYHFI
jgi:hypothetical protein